MIGRIALLHVADPGLAGIPGYQRAGLDAIAACGTVAAGVHVEACDACGDRRVVPNTCGHRSCPHCQARERAAWVEARLAELLPVGFFHVVLTLPPELRRAASAFPAVVLDALLQASGDVIDCLGKDPRWLGAEVGQLAILHTWTRDLRWHPHVHVIVTAGGWDSERGRWIDARRYGRDRRPFLVPKDVLSAAFQRRLRRHLLRRARAGAFGDGGALPELASADALARHLARASRRPWVVRIEPPFGGPQQLVKYLGAYVNRAAVSASRIAYDADTAQVIHTWSSNAEPTRQQTTTYDPVAFLRAFAQHILPPRFHRIRFRGLWCTAHRRTKLHAAQVALASRRPTPTEPPAPPPLRQDRCTCCGLGHYQRLPGPCRRPSRSERRRLMDAIRRGVIDATHGGATTAA